MYNFVDTIKEVMQEEVFDKYNLILDDLDFSDYSAEEEQRILQEADEVIPLVLAEADAGDLYDLMYAVITTPYLFANMLKYPVGDVDKNTTVADWLKPFLAPFIHDVIFA